MSKYVHKMFEMAIDTKKITSSSFLSSTYQLPNMSRIFHVAFPKIYRSSGIICGWQYCNTSMLHSSKEVSPKVWRRRLWSVHLPVSRKFPKYLALYSSSPNSHLLTRNWSSINGSYVNLYLVDLNGGNMVLTIWEERRVRELTSILLSTWKLS